MLNFRRMSIEAPELGQFQQICLNQDVSIYLIAHKRPTPPLTQWMLARVTSVLKDLDPSPKRMVAMGLLCRFLRTQNLTYENIAEQFGLRTESIIAIVDKSREEHKDEWHALQARLNPSQLERARTRDLEIFEIRLRFHRLSRKGIADYLGTTESLVDISLLRLFQMGLPRRTIELDQTIV